MNLLFIDDDEDTNLLVGFLLDKAKDVESYHIESSARNALDYLKSQKASPDCILVDLKMPDMDGFQFIERYEQELQNPASDACIYILSSSARSSDREKALAYKSVRGFILKPISKKKIADLCAEYMKRSRDAVDSGIPDGSAAASNQKL